MPSIHDFNCTTITGESRSLRDFEGQVLLIVNTASRCGFTPQFQGLEDLYRRYKEQGLNILGFPCNQFGKQDPGSNEDIAGFCDRHYGVSFPMFAKINVNGDDADPLFKHLRAEAPGVMGSQAIKWNFTKFLVDRQGQVVKRYAPATKPDDLAGDIEALL